MGRSGHSEYEPQDTYLDDSERCEMWQHSGALSTLEKLQLTSQDLIQRSLVGHFYWGAFITQYSPEERASGPV